MITFSSLIYYSNKKKVRKLFWTLHLLYLVWAKNMLGITAIRKHLINQGHFRKKCISQDLAISKETISYRGSGLSKASNISSKPFIICDFVTHMSMVSCQKGPTRHAYAWQIGPFWQDTLMCGFINWVIIDVDSGLWQNW